MGTKPLTSESFEEISTSNAKKQGTNVLDEKLRFLLRVRLEKGDRKITVKQASYTKKVAVILT